MYYITYGYVKNIETRKKYAKMLIVVDPKEWNYM